MPEEENNEVIEKETVTVGEGESQEVVRNFKVVSKKKTKLKHEGIADDFVDASVNGKQIARNRKKQLFNEDDDVETMEKATAELISDSSRKIFKKIEEDENNRLNEILERVYTPTKKKTKMSESKLVKSLINIV